MNLPWFHTIKIGSLYLTEDETVTGTPYVSVVSGLDAVSDGLVAQQIIAIDGTPHQQTTQPVKGVLVTIRCQWMERDMLFALKAIRLAAITSATTTTLTLLDNSHGTGDFTLTTYFNSIRWPGEFMNGKVKDVTMSFTVSSVGYLVTGAHGTLALAGQSVTLTQA